jgi:hypothetical protein
MAHLVLDELDVFAESYHQRRIGMPKRVPGDFPQARRLKSLFESTH